MTADEGPAPSALSLLRDRRWSGVAISSMVSLVGFWNFAIVGALVIQQQTGRVLLVGVFTSLQFGANLLLSPFAGTLFDGVGTKAAMVSSAAASAVVGGGLAMISWLGVLNVAWVFAGAIVAGVASAITTPGLQVLMQEVLGRHEISTAVVVQSAAMTLARAIGPALAGAWLFLDAHAAAFLTHGLGYALFATAIGCAHSRQLASRAGMHNMSLAARLRALGLTSRQRRVLLGLLALTLAVAWGADPINTLLPALAEQHGYGDRGVGAIASAFGIGAVAATAGYNWLAVRWRRSGLSAAGLALLGASLAAGAVVEALPLAGVAFAVGGAGFVVAFTSVTSALQAFPHLPNRHGIRDIMGLWSAAFIGGRLPASLANGVVADVLGVIPATVLVGTSLVVVGLAVACRSWNQPS